MYKKQILLGFILGIVASTLFSSIIFFNNYSGMPSEAYMKFFIKEKLIVPVISLSLLANFGLFFLFLKFNKDEISKGILLATILIGIALLVLKFA